MRPVWGLILLAACATRPPAELLIEEVPLVKEEPTVQWRIDGEQALEYARSKRKPVLLYFTAEW
ncbi:MAG: hypothetical protein ACYTHK_17285 [Planctomycetota bacterium]|jgi:hypothetical protein